MVAGIELSGQAAGGLRSPVADGGRGCVASPCRADVAARERAEVGIARKSENLQLPLAFQKELVHTAGQWQSSDIAGERSLQEDILYIRTLIERSSEGKPPQAVGQTM